MPIQNRPEGRFGAGDGLHAQVLLDQLRDVLAIGVNPFAIATLNHVDRGVTDMIRDPMKRHVTQR